MKLTQEIHGCAVDRRSQRGGALLMVLGIVIVLSLAVFSVFEIILPGLSATSINSQVTRAIELAESGVAMAAHPLVSSDDPLLDQQLNHGESLRVKVRSEGGKLNINFLVASNNVDPLVQLFYAWGLEAEDASALADRIFDWIDADELARLNGMERPDYADSSTTAQPPNRPLYQMSELESLPGIEVLQSQRPDWQKSFTIWSDGPLNLNAAPADLIAAVTGVLPDQVDPLIRLRQGNDGIEFTEDDYQFGTVAEATGLLQIPPERLPLISSYVSIRGSSMRISSRATVRDVSRTIEVVLRSQESAPVLLSREVKGSHP